MKYFFVFYSFALLGIPEPEVKLNLSAFEIASKKTIQKSKAEVKAFTSEEIVNEVSEIVVKNKDVLFQCVEHFRSTTKHDEKILNVILEIPASGRGIGRIDSEKNPLVSCLEQKLSSFNYPSHSLVHAIRIKFPLELREL